MNTTKHGECPRCGSRPQKRNPGKANTRSAHNPTVRRDDSLDGELNFGTLWDHVTDEWSCQDCGCQFRADGSERSMVEEWGLHAVEDWEVTGWQNKRGGAG